MDWNQLVDLSGLVLVGAAWLWASLGWFYSFRRRSFDRRLASAWRSATQRHGVRPTILRSGRHFGRLGQLEVMLQVPILRLSPGTEITVSGFSLAASRLTIEHQGSDHDLASQLRRDSAGIGDPVFDAEFSVHGDLAVAQAVLDAETRMRLTEWLRGKGSFRRGKLRLLIPHPWKANARELSDQVSEGLRQMLVIAGRVATHQNVAVCLAQHLGADQHPRDPEEGVRSRSLHLLLREFPQQPATARALAAVRRDPSERMRLEGAIAEGEAGRATLLELLSSSETSESVAAKAVEKLADALPFEVLEEVLRRGLEAGRSEQIKACLAWLGRSGGADAEAQLVARLRDHDVEVARAAVRGLGHVGTVAAVPALSEAESRGPRDVSRAARQAIAEIQARLEGAEAGQLSLAARDAGALSLTEEGEAGRVSLVRAEERTNE